MELHQISENKSPFLTLSLSSHARESSDIWTLHHISTENDLFVIKWRKSIKYPKADF